MKKVIIGVIVVLVIIGGVLVKVNVIDKGKKDNNNGNSNTNRVVDNKVIHYYYGYYLFDIEINEEKLDVTRYTVVQCIQAPCDPIKDKMFTVNNKDEYDELFNRIFSNSEEKEKTIYSDKLSNDEYQVLLDIIGEKDIRNTEKYKIIDTVDNYDSEYVDRGYHVEEEEDGNYLITVAMGSRNTGGYSIKIKDVVINDNDVLIYVKETSPQADSVVTMAFTYPIAKVELLFKPGKIEVQNVDSFKEYERLD